jgi:hypothetical protein
MIKKLLFVCLLVSTVSAVIAQTGKSVLRGKIADADNTKPVVEATVVLSNTGKLTTSGTDGSFQISDLAPGKYTLVVTHAGFLPFEIMVDVKANTTTEVNADLTRDVESTKPSDLPVINLSESDVDQSSAIEVADLLFSTRDVFQTTMSRLNTFRFRARGYDSGLSKIYINGVPFNDPETGSISYGDFSGLNNIFRNSVSTVGLDPSESAFGDVGGVVLYDTRAANQRKQVRVSYNYNSINKNRVMLNLSTGLMPGGWAVSLSASHRWAYEGYRPGTNFQGTSYFLSIDKRFTPEHSLNFTFFGAPTIRGRDKDSYQAMFDVAGSNYYNPLWGYQNGDKRNSAVVRNNQPVGILRYDFTPATKMHLTIAAYGQAGTTGSTRINWVNGSNPYPDYNYNLPTAQPDSAAWAKALSSDEALRQINWAGLYDVNRNNVASIANVNGIAGNTVTGKRSIYIVEDQREKTREGGVNLIFTNALTSRINLNGGLEMQFYRGQHYKVIDDLLGGDYWTDWDFFGQFDPSSNVDGRQADLLHPNRLVKKGDIFGYNYYENIRNSHAWAQTQFSLPHFQFFVSGEVGKTDQWRTGLMQNGRFPTTSLGDSRTLDWITWGLKGGAVWKVNGRNYLYANGYYGVKPPSFRNSFLSANYRNDAVPGIDVYTVRSVEGGYQFRSPNFRARITGFFTEMLNQTESRFVPSVTASRVLSNSDLNDPQIGPDFLQLPIFLGGAIMKGINTRHTGVEAAVEYKVIPSVTLTAAGSVGKYIYTSRPEMYLAPDNTSSIIDIGQIYQKNFYVPRTPQKTATAGIRYESRQFWSVTLSVNYAADMYYEFDRLRRTAAFVNSFDGLNPAVPAWRTVVDQLKAPAAFTVDLVANKSWRIKGKYFLSLNAGINNLLNNQKIVISGREAYVNDFKNNLLDPRFYAPEILYAPGFNFFFGIALRM